ncbi:enoyl-ACP reductase FabI [Silvanigrella aquatica]|uniref:Enoyl-[acyl-carrier-protein] reductase [NADH] n=1 Tax=Silvanigrella aquatica TaxID=1915309 RepID=A0A1L4CZX5_9BACT|nr:enoyl-ACP reductase [Silvanigrella aquatica]APJ03501.1 enoyl-ACP reductase [Silvanigrella aquatica]
MNNAKILAGKRGIVFGVANNKSIAWACAQMCAEQGAELAFNFLGDAQEKRVRELVKDLPNAIVMPCDVTKDEQIEAFYTEIQKQWDMVDFIIHSVAFTEKENLKDKFMVVTRESFASTMDISAYSLLAVTRAALPLMKKGGSVITMSYYGAEKVVPRYNVMGVAKAALESCAKYLAYDLGEIGIRVNAISAGPIRTLSSSAIPGIKEMLENSQKHSPLKRNVTTEDVARSALYLLSDLGSGVTGEVLHVDCGYNTLGMFSSVES